MLEGVKASYLWLAKVYQSVLARNHSKTFLWDRYGVGCQVMWFWLKFRERGGVAVAAR